MKPKLTRQTIILVIVGAATATGCAETVRLSRGSRIPPEHRGVSSAEVTEAFTRHARGEHVSMAATLIDFSYVRAITLERGRSRDQEREAYGRYVRRQTTFYVNLVLHGRESCRPEGARRSRRDDEDDAESGDELRLEGWTFRLRSSSGREREPEDIEPGATQLAPSGGCLVQGYVHFPGNISSRDEWLELEARAGERGRLNSKLRWHVEHWAPPRSERRPPRERPRPRPEPRDDTREPVEDDAVDEPREDDFGDAPEEPTQSESQAPEPTPSDEF